MWCLGLLLVQMDRQKYEIDTLLKSLQTTLALSATLKQCFEQPSASFLVCSLIFIEYKLSKEPSFAEKQGFFAVYSIPESVKQTSQFAFFVL